MNSCKRKYNNHNKESSHTHNKVNTQNNFGTNLIPPSTPCANIESIPKKPKKTDDGTLQAILDQLDALKRTVENLQQQPVSKNNTIPDMTIPVLESNVTNKGCRNFIPGQTNHGNYKDNKEESSPPDIYVEGAEITPDLLLEIYKDKPEYSKRHISNVCFIFEIGGS